MAEKVEEQVVAQSEGDGKKAAPKSNEQIGEENRIGLYNEILKLKEPGFSDEYKKIGYKKFNSLLQNDRQFQSDLLADLNDRGFNINPENFTAAYTKQAPVAVYDFSKTQEATPAPEVTKEDEGFFGTVKNMAKWAYNYGKDFYKTVKRDIYTGQAQSGAQVEDFLAGKVDTDNLAHYLKKAHEVGNIQIEAEYAKDEGALKDAGDFIAMLGPAIVGSFSSMAAAGWKKMAGITAAGAGAGAAYGAAGGAAAGGVGAAPGALAGAITGAGRGAQTAMVQQGYNLEFVGSVIDELTEKGAINPDADEKTLKKQLDAAFANKELMKPIYEKANTRAGIIMGVDVLASGIGGKVVGTLRRAAMSKPVARTTIGRVLQQSAQAAAQSAPARVAVKMAERAADVGAKFAKTKVGKSVDALDVLDIASGAGGEALAQLKTEGKIDWKEVALEGGAEGSYIKALRALGDIGNRKQELLGLPQARTPEALPSGPDKEFGPVTQEEFDAYRKGNISPERAAGITTDVDIAIEDPSHLEKLKTENPLYAQMVTEAFNKHIVAVENQKLYNVALDDVAELHGKTAEEVKAAITPNTPTFNQKIADDFRNSFSVLQKQYREKAQNDSENAAGVSGEGGIGTKPEQAQSQQGAGQEAAGDGGIFQEAEGEARLAEIDELLADDDAFFAENNDRLLSPEERADLVKERESIAGPQAAAPTGLSTGATPAAAPAEVVTGATPAAGGTVASATPVQQATPSTVPATTASTAEVKKVDENERNQYGQLINLPKIEKSGQVETASLDIEKGVFTSNKSYVPSSYDVIKLEISKDGKTALFTVDTSMKRGIGDLQTNLGGLNPFVSYRKVGGDVFGIENVEPGVAEKQQDGSWKVIRKGAVNITGRKNVTEKNREGEAESPWTPELLAKRYKPQAVAAPTEGTKETEAVSKAAATTAAPTTGVTTTPATEAAAKPAAKEIKSFDVEIRKGKTHDKDGVYEAVYKGKVIGKMSFDKKKKMWVDASGDKFAQKKNAVARMVLQYNMKQEGKETPTTKTEGKEKTATTGKTISYPMEEKGKWYGDENYEERGGKLVKMSPDEFLSRTKELIIDEEARDNINTLKEHIKNGGKLDPLAIYLVDKTKSNNSDGRHRAIAAKELGIKEVPVLDFTTRATKIGVEEKGSVETTTEVGGKAKAAPTTKPETKGEVKPTEKTGAKPQTPKTNPFAETVREGMEALMGAIGSKVKMNFLSPEEAAKIAAMPEKKRGKLLFQTTAWHGTPHTFSKFKTEKINTGEQAQAFGWGLYFTDDKEVAEYYANELAGLKDNISLEELKNILPPSPNFESLANHFQRNVRVRGINEGVQKFKEDVELLGEDFYTPEELEFVKNLKQEDVQTKNVYKVTLFKGKKRYVTAPIKSSDGKWNVYDSVVWDKIQAMPSIERQGILDNFDKVKPQKRFNSKEEASNWIADNNEYTWLVWDKRVDKAQVKGLLLQLTKDQLKKFNNSFFAGLPLDATNQDLYYGLKRALGGAEQASMFLLENGIDGVKYPAKSVGTGITSDTARDFNYVVFDENAITIEERNGETIPIQVAVGYRGIRGQYRADYNGIQYFAVNERYAKVFGNNIIKASISTDKILDLDKYNKLLEEKGLETFGNEGFFTIDYSIFDEDGNFSADSMLGSMGRAKAQIGLKEFNKIYDQFVKEFNNADVIYGEDIGNPGEKVYAVKNPNAINTNNVDAAAPEGVQYMKTPDGKILGFVQKLPDGSYNVYINPETQDAETPVHEIAGHIFLPLIKESNPELYNQGTALIQNSEYMGKANGDIAEALALAVGDKGKLLAEKPRKGFMEWLKGMWEWVGDKLRLNPDKIKNLTLGQFTDLIAGSVLKGKELAGTKPTETGEAKPTVTAAPAKVPSFSEFDAISADRSKMKEAKAEFIAKHGQLAYDAMKEISANFTKITKALQAKEILTKKC